MVPHISAEILLTKYLLDKQIILQSKEADKTGKYDEESELQKLESEFIEEMQKYLLLAEYKNK